MLQIVASLTDDTRSVNYDRNTFIIQATGFTYDRYYNFIVQAYNTVKYWEITIRD